ncbi:hypothetical protein LSAT2_030002, partial [Lamellibrachia satsuma]
HKDTNQGRPRTAARENTHTFTIVAGNIPLKADFPDVVKVGLKDNNPNGVKIGLKDSNPDAHQCGDDVQNRQNEKTKRQRRRKRRQVILTRVVCGVFWCFCCPIMATGLACRPPPVDDDDRREDPCLPCYYDPDRVLD